MAKPRKDPPTAKGTTEEPKVKKVVQVTPKKPGEWMALVDAVSKTHWRKLRVTIQVREWLMAGKPATLNAANAMLKARGLEDQIVAVPIDDPAARAAAAETVSDEGLCEFHRREGREGIWLPSNNIKAGIKENWSVLGLRMAERGSRGALAEGMFVMAPGEGIERDWVYLGDAPSGVHTAVSHTTGASGPVSSIKRHEYVVRPKLTFDIAIERGNNAPKLSDEGMAKMLYHFGEHGLGACRSQGYGKWDLVAMEEVEEGVATQAA